MPRLVPGGLLVADNAVGFEDVMQPMLDRALSDERVDGAIVRFLTGQLDLQEAVSAMDAPVVRSAVARLSWRRVRHGVGWTQ